MSRPLLFLAALLAVAGCDEHAETRREASPLPPKAGAPHRPPLAPAGPAVPLQPLADPALQHAASVVEVRPLAGGSAKLFATAGRDPAMNGLYLHLAVFAGPAEGWRVYRIGDFISFTVLRERPGGVDLEVRENILDPASGAIGERRRRLIVGVSADPSGAPPDAVSVTPAR